MTAGPPPRGEPHLQSDPHRPERPVRETCSLGGTVQYCRGRGREVRLDLERVYRLFPLLRDWIERRLSSERAWRWR
jgi:hypothetical protein